MNSKMRKKIKSLSILAAAAVMAVGMTFSPCVVTADSSAVSGQTKTYKAHLELSAGEAKEKAETAAFYKKWKKAYLRKDKYCTTSTRKFVWYSGKTHKSTGSTTPVTVSEAQGYGMLITVDMAGEDTSAQSDFNALWRFCKAHRSKANSGSHLIAWQQSDTGKKYTNTNGPDSAADGDIDIAYALLKADETWGSDGSVDYKSAAVDMINDIYKYEVNKSTYKVQIGDWTQWSSSGSHVGTTVRSSDLIMAELRAFAAATGNTKWNKVISKSYSLVSSINSSYSGKRGLLPDFMYKSKGKYRPEHAYKREGQYDGAYSYNACRVPWRIGTDYLVSGSSSAKTETSRLNKWIRKKTGNDPSKIKAGYKLSGKATVSYSDMCFTAPFLVSAICDTSGSSGAQKWADSLWTYVTSKGISNYYNDSIKMICMITVSGQWK